MTKAPLRVTKGDGSAKSDEELLSEREAKGEIPTKAEKQALAEKEANARQSPVQIEEAITNPKKFALKQIAPNGEAVIGVYIVPHEIIFTTDSHLKVKLEPGVYEIPKEIAEHKWIVAHGVKLARQRGSRQQGE